MSANDEYFLQKRWIFKLHLFKHIRWFYLVNSKYQKVRLTPLLRYFSSTVKGIQK